MADTRQRDGRQTGRNGCLRQPVRIGLVVAEVRAGHDLGNRGASLAGDEADDHLGRHSVNQIGPGRRIAMGDRCDPCGPCEQADQRELDLQQACPMTNAR